MFNSINEPYDILSNGVVAPSMDDEEEYSKVNLANSLIKTGMRRSISLDVKYRIVSPIVQHTYFGKSPIAPNKVSSVVLVPSKVNKSHSRMGVRSL